jgi:DNA-binding XRE family transcriptional regulator
MKSRITEILLEKKKSKGWLARVTDISRPYISRLALDKAIPNLYTAYRISHALGCTVEEIWPYSED